jgi:hypothetical protein
MPMVNKSGPEVAKSLIEFTNDVGIPDELIIDGATEFTGKHTEFVKQCCQIQIRTRWTKSGRRNENYASEDKIGILSHRWRQQMTKKNVPKSLLDFELVYEWEILSRMARRNDRRTGYEEVTGETPDISEWLDFKFYDLVWWWHLPGKPNVTDNPR